MSTRVVDLLLRTWPRDFRRAHGRAVREAAGDQMRHAAAIYGRGGAAFRTMPRLSLDIVITALRLRRDQLFGRGPSSPLRHLPRRENTPMDSLLQDIRYGTRYLFRTPAVTALAVAALALGIGANTLVFSLVNGILLQPLPFPDAGRLVHLWESHPGRGWDTFSVSPQNYRDWKDQGASFAAMTGIYGGTFTITGGDEPLRISGATVADDFFPALGVEFVLGRGFTRDEHVAGANTVVVIGPGLWQRRFGGTAEVLGQEMIVDGSTRTIIGVLADPLAAVPSNAEIWEPMDLDQEYTVPRGAKYWRVIGRLHPAVTVAQASDEIEQIASRLVEGGWTAVVTSMHGDVTGRARRSLTMLFVAVGLVLLIACANVANLLLARASGRARELSLRQSVGASAGRLFRQLLTESTLLATMGATAGIGVAVVGLAVIRATADDTLPRMAEVQLDPFVLLFTLGVGLGTGLIFGVLPAIQGMRVTPARTLKDGGAGAGTGRGQARLRAALVVGEVALAVAIVGVAGLLTRSLLELQNVDPGFVTENRVTARVALPGGTYADAPARAAFYDALLDGLRDQPAVTSVGAITGLPLASDFSISFSIVGQESADENDPSSELRAVDPGYFESMGIPLLGGRGIETTDRADAEPVVVVSQTFVDRFLPEGDPIGRILDIGYGAPDTITERRIVGVVGDVKLFGLDDQPRPIYYLSRHQTGFRNMSIIVHSTLPVAQAHLVLREAIRAADVNLVPYEVRTLGELVHETTATERLRLGLIGSFAALAVTLAGIGIYGMLSFGVAQRRQEIGLRLAIGARPGDVLRLVLRSGLGLALLGVVLGSGGAILLGRAAAAQLYGIAPHDPATLLAVAASVLLVAALACWMPARRATGVDPVATLRS